MVTAELHLFGPASLVVTGRPVKLHSAKTLSLLTFLVLEADRSHSREKLAGLLWGESPESRARQSLRQALYSLRRALAPLAKHCLVLSKGTIIFQSHPGFKVDALEFLNLAAADPRSCLSFAVPSVFTKARCWKVWSYSTAQPSRNGFFSVVTPWSSKLWAYSRR